MLALCTCCTLPFTYKHLHQRCTWLCCSCVPTEHHLLLLSGLTYQHWRKKVNHSSQQLLYYLWTTIQTCICCEHHKYIGLDVGPSHPLHWRPAATHIASHCLAAITWHCLVRDNPRVWVSEQPFQWPAVESDFRWDQFTKVFSVWNRQATKFHTSIASYRRSVFYELWLRVLFEQAQNVMLM